MTNKTVLSDAALIERIVLDEKFQAACQRYAHGNGSSHAIATAAMQALLQSPEIQRLEKIVEAAEKVLSMPKDGGYIVLTVYLDELRAAMEVKP